MMPHFSSLHCTYKTNWVVPTEGDWCLLCPLFCYWQSLQSVYKAATIVIDKTQVTQNPLCHLLIACDQEDNYFKEHSRKYEKVQMYPVVPGIGGRGGGVLGAGGGVKWNVVKANPVNIMYFFEEPWWIGISYDVVITWSLNLPGTINNAKQCITH